MLYGDHGLHVTTCVIGNIDTESAKNLTKDYMVAMPRASAADCAYAIVSV